MFRKIPFHVILMLFTLAWGVSVWGNSTDQYLLAQELLPEGFPGGKGPLMGSRKNISRGPATFQPNLGQMASSVDFVAKSNGYRMYVTGSDLVFDLLSMDESLPGVAPGLVTVNLVGANMMLAGQGEDKQPSVSNYLYGKDESKWVYDVPTYSKVRYSEVYPGIDLVFYGNGEREMEHDFIVSPGANYRDIKLAIQGSKSISLHRKGYLDIEAMGGGNLRLKKPLVYQTTSAGLKIEIPSHYEVNGNQISFWIDESKYDSSLDLVIDPVTLSYSSYLGGSSDDVVLGMAVDSSGNMYVAGYTKSNDFTQANSGSIYNLGSFRGDTDAFFASITSTGTLSVSTYCGGSGDDVATSVTVDSSGSLFYATGYTTSNSNFPSANPGITWYSSPASDNHHGGTFDAFIVKASLSTLSPSLITFVGGSGFDAGMGIGLDMTSSHPFGITCGTGSLACMIVAGTTTSTDVNYYSRPVSWQSANGGSGDAFIARIQPSGGSGFWTYYGGTGRDIGIGLVVDSSNPANYYIAGQTNSSSAIASAGVFQTSAQGARDGFVAKLRVDGNYGITVRTWGSYVGTTGDDFVGGIAVNSSNPYIIGSTSGSGFTSSNGTTYNGTNSNGTAAHGGKDIFIAKLSSTAGQVPTYLTFIGGTGDDDVPGVQSIAVDSTGVAIFGGRTKSLDITTVGAISGAGYSAYPSGATSVGLFGRTKSANTATSFTPLSYLGTASGATDLISAVALKRGDNLNFYLGGYASEAEFPSAGKTVRSYGGQKDGITSQFLMTCTDDVSNCQDLYQVGPLMITQMIAPAASSNSTTPSQTITPPTTYNVIGGGGYATQVSGGGVGFLELLSYYSINTTGQIRVMGNDNWGVDGSPQTFNVRAYAMLLQSGGAALSVTTGSCSTIGSPSTDLVICNAVTGSANPVSATATLPSGYTLIGGSGHVSDGVTAESYMTGSYPSPTSSTMAWTVEGRRNSHIDSTTSATAEAYVVGIRDGYLSSNSLTVTRYSTSTTAVTGGTNLNCTVPAGKLLGGGVRAVITNNGQWVTRTYPSSNTTWTVQTRDSVKIDDTATIYAYCIGIQ
jgi:hypothetical protein